MESLILVLIIASLFVGLVFCAQPASAGEVEITYTPDFQYEDLDTGIKMAYVEMGNKSDPPVVLIHGVTDSFMSFSQVAPRIAAEGYYVIVPELRGHGRTDKPEAGPYTVQMHASDINSLLNILGVKAANITGHSLGSLIAQAIAIHYPDKVSSLTLIATSANAKENETIIWVLEGDDDFPGINNVTELSDDFLRDWTISSNYDPVFVEKTFEHAKQLPLYVWVNAFKGIVTPEGLEKITVPVQIIRGSEDFFTLDEHLDLIRQIKSNYILFLHKHGYDHNTQWEEHMDKEVATDIVKFLKTI